MGDLIDVDMDALEGDGVIRVSNAEYLSRPLRLAGSEAAALIVALRALREGGDETVRPVVDRALRKLEEAAGETAAAAAQVDIRGDGQQGALAGLRRDLEEAVRGRRQVRLDYYVPSRDETTERVVDPVRVVSAEGHTYLDAWCHVAEDQRLFRLDRVTRAEVLDSAVERHDVAPRDLSEGLFRPSEDDLLVTLRLDPATRWVAEYYPVEDVAEVDDGGLRVRLRVADPAWLTRLVMRTGAGAIVVDPPELADAVRRTAQQALAAYAAGTRTMDPNETT
jgi:proteasome accessory factor C